MRARRAALLLAAALAAATAACNDLPGRPGPESSVLRPSEVTNFQTLYAQNCAACHGTQGKGGAAVPLNDPVYLAIASDDVLRHTISAGVPGTPMPAFARNDGGMLAAKQVDALVAGIRQWANPSALGGATPPVYAAKLKGDPARGAKVYATFCSSCHGPGGNGGEKAGSVVNSSFLALASDQELRTLVIVGLPDLGAPDWRGDVPGRQMTDQEVTDVVAWLASNRTRYPGEPYHLVRPIPQREVSGE